MGSQWRGWTGPMFAVALGLLAATSATAMAGTISPTHCFGELSCGPGGSGDVAGVDWQDPQPTACRLLNKRP